MTNVKDKISDIINNEILCDITLPFSPEVEVSNKWDVVENYKNIGFNFVSLTLAIDTTSFDKTIHYISEHRNYILSNKDKYVLVESVNDIYSAQKQNKLAISFNFQGTGPIANDINMVEFYYKLGVRQIILAYNAKNSIGDGCHERTDAGLSNLGFKLIKEMNKIGMIIDCSHTGYKTSMESMEISTCPVIFSHSNAYSVYQHPRNIKDDQIKACVKTGGVIGINGVGNFVGKNDASPKKIFEHLDYIVQLVGPNHVSIGLDYVYFEEVLYGFIRKNPSLFGEDGKIPIPWHFFKPDNISKIIELMLNHNYDNNSIKNILGKNYLKVASRVWK